MFDNLLLARDAAVAILTINRPQVLHALNTATLDEIRHAIVALSQDASGRVVSVTGAWEKAFAAGADINELAALFGLLASTEDMREQTAAFLEKRQPVFKGK